MGLNIKNDDTCLLARDLARLTGETMTGAITVALRERLAREKRRRDLDARIEELLAIGRRCAESLEPGPSAVEHLNVGTATCSMTIVACPGDRR